MSEARVRTATTPSEARRFGLLVGGAFLVIALISWFRGKSVPVNAGLAGLGAALVLLGVTVPIVLIPVFRAWMGLARVLSRVTTPLFMGVVYFVVLTPIGAVRRLLGSNPLVAKRGSEGFWSSVSRTTHSMERQF